MSCKQKIFHQKQMFKNSFYGERLIFQVLGPPWTARDLEDPRKYPKINFFWGESERSSSKFRPDTWQAFIINLDLLDYDRSIRTVCPVFFKMPICFTSSSKHRLFNRNWLNLVNPIKPSASSCKKGFSCWVCFAIDSSLSDVGLHRAAARQKEIGCWRVHAGPRFCFSCPGIDFRS